MPGAGLTLVAVLQTPLDSAPQLLAYSTTPESLGLSVETRHRPALEADLVEPGEGVVEWVSMEEAMGEWLSSILSPRVVDSPAAKPLRQHWLWLFAVPDWLLGLCVRLPY